MGLYKATVIKLILKKRKIKVHFDAKKKMSFDTSVYIVESFIDKNATMSATDDKTEISTDNVVEESDDYYDDNDYVDDDDDNDSNYQNHPQIVLRPLPVNRQSSRDGVYDIWPKSECF